MIELFRLNKYYSKNKSNEIHVINDTSLKFPEIGLVAITGPSGCGKTTLLNVIGGLDSFSAGEIYFEGHEIKKYIPYEWDRIRNKYVGYIFQNYNLVNDKTVYENVEMALNMSGLYDKEKLKKRINYVLTTVGMYNYRKRNVQALSGGQQQRVAIARAIAKNPKLVLADEPTGNLDANNTFEIMSIIKKISQTCLVILVSHEKELVDFYADRVIELSDGKVINDYSHTGNRTLKHVDERNIYLKDLNEDESLKESGIERYYDQNKDDSLALKIVELKDSVYIKVNSQKKIKYLTDDTEINLINDHYKERKTEDVDKYEFDLDQFGAINAGMKRLSFIKFWDSFKKGFIKTLTKKGFIGKLFILAYFIISAIVVYQIASFGSITRIDPKDYLTSGRDMVMIDMATVRDTFGSSDINNILTNVDNIDLSPYFTEVFVSFSLNEYYQGNVNTQFQAYPMKKSWIDSADLVAGRMPQNDKEIVIDKWIADNLIDNKQMTDLNITDINHLLNFYIRSNGVGNFNFKIVGIVQTESPIIVVNDNAIYSFFSRFNIGYNTYTYIPRGTAATRITILDGRDIQTPDEVLALQDYTDLAVGDTYDNNGITYKVVGIFKYNDANVSGTYNVVVDNSVFSDVIKRFDTKSVLLYEPGGGLYFHADNVSQAVTDINTYLNNNNTGGPITYAHDSYQYQMDAFQSEKMAGVAARVELIVVVLGGIVIFIFFMMRSSMINRIKEIGIYRSIGASKLDIYKIFFGEIIAFTTIGSLSGYLLMTLLILRVQNMMGKLISAFYLPIHYFLGGILGIYLINVIFGMLPIFTLLRKTPSEINAKYDI